MPQTVKQSSNTNEEDLASQYAAMSQFVVRPPSRHKEPPQNQGLDLPGFEEDHHPSLQEDSGSSDEFEIGIAQAAKHHKESYTKLN